MDDSIRGAKPIDVSEYWDESQGMFNATTLLFYYNKNHLSKHRNTPKRIFDYLSNINTKSYINVLSQGSDRIGILKTRQGKYGGTFMCYELFANFYNWLYAIPLQKFTRQETIFSEMLQTMFLGLLELKPQYPCMGYFIDLYCPILHLAIEFDEGHHVRKSVSDNDELRQQRIEILLGCSFLRVKAGEEYIAANYIIKQYVMKRIVEG